MPAARTTCVRVEAGTAGIRSLSLTFAAALMAACAAAQPPAAAPPPDNLATSYIARVGDREISALEFKRELEYLALTARSLAGKPPADTPAFRAQALDDLLTRTLLALLAANAGVEVPEAELEAELARRKRSFSSDAGYQAWLDRNGYTEDDVKARVRDRMRADRYVARETKNLAVSEDGILAEYNRLRGAGRLQRPFRTADVRHLLVRAEKDDAESMAAAERAVRDAAARIAAGAAFEDLVRELSDDLSSLDDGGLVYEVAPGRLPAEIDAWIEKLGAGAVSDPFSSGFGWHLIRIEQFNEPGLVPLSKVRERIEEQLLAPKRAKAVQEIVERNSLLMRIEVYPAPTPPAPPAAAAPAP